MPKSPRETDYGSIPDTNGSPPLTKFKMKPSEERFSEKMEQDGQKLLEDLYRKDDIIERTTREHRQQWCDLVGIFTQKFKN